MTMPLMKILYSRTQFWFNLKAGGSVVHTSGVIKGLKKYGEVKVMCNEVPYGIDGDDCICVSPVLKKKLNVSLGEILYNFYYASKLKKAIQHLKPAFVYHRYSRYSFATAKLCKQLELPVVLEFNSFETWKMKYWDSHANILFSIVNRFILSYVTAKIERFNLDVASLVVTVSTPLKESLISYGISEDKIIVNPNGVDSEKFRPDIDGSRVRKKFGIEGKVVAGFMGTFGRWHGAEVLAASIKEVVKNNENVHFLIVGDGLTMHQVKEIIRSDNMSRHVTLTGLVPQKEASEYLAACDIFVSPHVKNADGTPFFGSPTKLFEYMAMGRAIVASDLDQIGEVLDHQKTAWMIKPGDVSELAEGILKLAGDENLRIKLAAGARKEVIAKYTWDKHVEKIVNALKEKAL